MKITLHKLTDGSPEVVGIILGCIKFSTNGEGYLETQWSDDSKLIRAGEHYWVSPFSCRILMRQNFSWDQMRHFTGAVSEPYHHTLCFESATDLSC